MAQKQKTNKPLQQATSQKAPQIPSEPVSPKPALRRMALLLFLVAFVLFAGTINHGFVLDDIAVIEQNKLVQMGFSGIPKLLSTFYWEGYWESNAGLFRPLSMIMFAIEWGVSPENPAIHHFMNVLLYAVSIVLLFRLLVRIFPELNTWIPFFITLLFAVHPIHSEVVANIKSRDEILCFLFFVLTFGYIVKTGLLTLSSKLLAAFLFLLCLLSKEAGILFLPVMGAWYMLFRQEKFVKAAMKLLPLIIISGLWLLLHQYIIRSSAFERITYTYHDNSLVLCEGAAQAATGIAILGRYMMNTVLPLNLSYDYSYNQIPCETFGSPIVLVTILIVSLAVFAMIRLRRSHPAVSFGLLFFFITIILATNIFTLIGTTMGDRLLFTPVLGICIVFVYGISALFRSVDLKNYKFSRIAVSLFGAIAIVCSAAAFQRNRDWESNAALFRADVKHAPNSARTHFNYGVVLMNELPVNIEEQGPYLPERIAAFKKAIAIDPKDAGSYINLGVCYYRLKDFKNSVIHTRKAMEINPADKSIYNNLADAYYKLNMTDSAAAYYRKTIDAGLATNGTYNFMGVMFFNEKRYPEAIAVFKEGLKSFPNNEELLMNLGSAYGSSNQYEEALAVFLKEVQINPGNKRAYYFLALTYQSLGDKASSDKYLAIYEGSAQ